MIDLLVVYVLDGEEGPVTTVPIKLNLGCLVVVVGDTVVFEAVVSLNLNKVEHIKDSVSFGFIAVPDARTEAQR